MAYRDMVCMILFNYLFILIYAIYQQDVFNERSNTSRNAVFSPKILQTRRRHDLGSWKQFPTIVS